MSKVVYIGKEGSGKTHLMGADTKWCIDFNERLYAKQLKGWEERKRAWEKHLQLREKIGTPFLKEEEKLFKEPLPIKRKIVSNITYSKSLEDYAKSKGIEIYYWKDIEELESFTECDLFIDEVGAYFDSRTFADLPLTTRLWLAQAQKLGVYIYAGAQDWGQIDVSFRRLVNKLYELKKFIGTRRPSKSIPAGKHPWAIILAWRVAPESSSDSSELRTLSMVPELHVATKKSFDRFDTNARISNSAPPPLKKITRVCPEDGYTRVQYR